MKIKINDHNYDNFKKILNQKFDNITENELSIYHELTNGSPGIAISIYEDNILESVNLTFEKLFLQKVDNNVLELIQSLSILDNDKFKTYLSVLKTILINLLKLKITDFETKIYNGNNLKFINDLSKKLSYKNILDRLEFLTNNENDLFKFNLDKKIFMLRFFTS